MLLFVNMLVCSVIYEPSKMAVCMNFPEWLIVLELKLNVFKFYFNVVVYTKIITVPIFMTLLLHCLPVGDSNNVLHAQSKPLSIAVTYLKQSVV